MVGLGPDPLKFVLLVQLGYILEFGSVIQRLVVHRYLRILSTECLKEQLSKLVNHEVIWRFLLKIELVYLLQDYLELIRDRTEKPMGILCLKSGLEHARDGIAGESELHLEVAPRQLLVIEKKG